MPVVPGQTGLGILLFLRQLRLVVRASIHPVEQTNQTVDLGACLGALPSHSWVQRMQTSPSSTVTGGVKSGQWGEYNWATCGARLRPPGGRSPSGCLMRARRIFEGFSDGLSGATLGETIA